MTLPINALREAAEQATSPSPWTVRNNSDDGTFTVLDADGMWVVECGAAPAEAEHIALWHPAQALAVLEEVERLTEALEREEGNHSETIEERDWRVKQIEEIADALGDEGEWNHDTSTRDPERPDFLNLTRYFGPFCPHPDEDRGTA